MATADALQGQAGAVQRTVPPDGFQGVSGAAGCETAVAQRSEQAGFSRGNDYPIELNPKNQDVLCHVHVPLSPFNNPAFLRLVKKSFSTSLKLLPTMEGLATSTRSTGTAS